MSIQANRTPVCLFGDVVNDDGSVSPDQYVLLVDGWIQYIGGDQPASVKRPDYTLADDELIFPAFLDLHTHASYNMLPLWHSPFWAWDNRFQWRGNADYKQSIGAVNRGIAAAYGHGTKIYQAYSAFSELLAIAGGTTVLQENAHLDSGGYPTSSHILIRSTGDSSDLGLRENEEIVSVTDFYEPDPYTAPRDPYQDTSRWGVKTVPKGSFDGATYVADFENSVTGTRTRGTIVHLAEGRSGYLQTKLGPDPYTRAEFEEFKSFITRNYQAPEDVARVRQARLLLIHGCGMDTVSRQPGTIQQTIDFLRTYGIAIVWSPVSNLLLYQDTTNVLPLLDAGIPVILGTDWTPSGSKTAWEEAKFAAFFLEARGWKGNASLACFRAITSLAADCLGLPLGRVKADNFADLVIVRRPAGARRSDALFTFRKATDAEVRAVFVGGLPLYGDADLLRALGARPSPLPGENPAGAKRGALSVAAKKSVALPEGSEITIEDLAQAIAAADHVVGKRRPKLLAADDADYLARMQELRAWVGKFDPKTSPNRKPQPSAPTGLAPGELEWMYNPDLDPARRTPPEVVELLGRVAPCRDVNCAVPKRHPYYHAEVLTQAGDSYGVRVPCMPVVPVLTNTKQLFVMGDYPTAKFAARSTNNLPVITGAGDPIGEANKELEALLHDAAQQPHHGDPLIQTYIEEIGDIVRQAYSRPDIDAAATRAHGQSFGKPEYTPPRKNQFFVPVGDVFAPMQDANYFDGYKVRNVAAGVFFQKRYLGAVGVDIERQVWLTNMIKCFLFHPSMAASYQALGWTDVRVEPSYAELLPVGAVCRQWINQEVVVCDPKLVLTVGKPPCTLLHNVPFADLGLQGRVYSKLLGQLLEAGDTRAETNIASHLKLTSKADPPFGRTRKAAKTGGGAAPKPPASQPQPVSITRIAPWSKYNVFHMLHPQAVMMSETAVAGGLVSAIQSVLGPKARGMSASDLNHQITRYVLKHGTAALVKALPYGQRDQFHASASMLETHAVTLANLADVLTRMKLVSGVSADSVLRQQAAELADTYHLAESRGEELKRLKALRTEYNAAFARISK
jgi:cytosine/adenosine deaminase-related metal-dependent hydrolase